MPFQTEFNIYDDIKNKLIVAILIIMECLFRLRKEFIDNNWHCAVAILIIMECLFRQVTNDKIEESRMNIVAILIIMECLFRRVFYKKSEILNKNLNNSKI